MGSLRAMAGGPPGACRSERPAARLGWPPVGAGAGLDWAVLGSGRGAGRDAEIQA